MTLYLGSRFYGAVILRALGIRVREHVQRSEVWACRIALLAAVAMVIMLRVFTGLNLLYSGLFVMLTGLLFLIVTRINVETGLFFVQPTWHAVGVILGIFGAGYLGAEALIVLGLLCVVMTIDPRVCLMPLVANALRFSENTGVRPYRLSKWLVLAVLLGLIVGVFATIYVQYDHGGAGYSWATQKVPKLAFNLLARNLPKIRQSAGAIKVNRELVRAAAVGMGLVLACSWFRLRYTWWPIHPVLFLVWGTFTMGVFAPSFLIGWIIKVAVTRFGGGDTYRKCKPLFIGMIAGEFVAGIFWMIVALIYYKVAGPGGPLFRVHP